MELNSNKKPDVHYLLECILKRLALPFPEKVDEKIRMLDEIISEANKNFENIVEVENYFNIRITDTGFLGHFFNPYSKELKYISACIEKSEEGIQKLNTFSALEHPGVSRSLFRFENEVDILKNENLPKLMRRRKKMLRKNYAILLVFAIAHIIFYGWLFQQI